MVYTHGHHDSVLESHRNRTIANSAAYAEAFFTPGARVLDIGSGPGTITAEIARRVEPGEVIAVEINDEAGAITERELSRQGVTNARVVIGDVHNLDLPDESFDVVHAHQVLQHVTNPVGALGEMRRVCRGGGIVAARDSDYGRFEWGPRVAELDEWLRLYSAAARANGGEPDAGRFLAGWAREAGFDEVVTSESTWEYRTLAECAWWGGMWAVRILESDLTHQLLREGRATASELEAISAGWRRWAATDGAWFVVQHSEILARG